MPGTETETINTPSESTLFPPSSEPRLSLSLSLCPQIAPLSPSQVTYVYTPHLLFFLFHPPGSDVRRRPSYTSLPGHSVTYLVSQPVSQARDKTWRVSVSLGSGPVQALHPVPSRRQSRVRLFLADRRATAQSPPGEAALLITVTIPPRSKINKIPPTKKRAKLLFLQVN